MVLKAGHLPMWQDDARRMQKLEPKNTVAAPWGNRSYEIRGANCLCYEWTDPNPSEWLKTVLHFVQDIEPWTDADGDHQSAWMWVSGKAFTRANGWERCYRMAHHRGDIEAHIRPEKYLGYAYQPLDSRDWNAMQGFHHLMHSARLLPILVLHPTSLWPMVFFLTRRETTIKLVEAARDSGVDKARIARLGEREQKPRLEW